MRICVLQPSYHGSKSSLKEVDTSFPNPGAFTSQHAFDNRFFHKDTEKEEIDAIIAEKFDFHINLLWGALDDDVAGIEVSRYLGTFMVPSAGIRCWRRSQNTNDFYETARRRDAPPVPRKDKPPLLVKLANGRASQMIDEHSLCHVEVELQRALRRINERLWESRLRTAKALRKEDPQTYADSYDPESRSSDDIVVQEYIDGQDYMVSVIVMVASGLALPPCIARGRETPEQAKCLAFDTKFNDQMRLEVISRNKNLALYDRLQEVALEAFETGMFRHNYMGYNVHMRVRPNGEVFAIDANPSACFLSDETGLADSPITQSLPGGYTALVNIFIANYFPQTFTLREWSRGAEVCDKVGPGYDGTIQTVSRIEDIIRRVTREYDYEGRVVDLACGTGGFGRLLDKCKCRPGYHHQRGSQVIGFDLSPGMVNICRALGFYSAVHEGRMQTCLLQHFTQGEVDHIVCFSAVHFLSAEEFAFLPVSCFVMARQSITIGVDETANVYNENLCKRRDSAIHSFNHLKSMEALGKPRGWSLVSRQREFGWTSPATEDDVYTTTFRFERADQKSLHGVRLARLTTRN